MKEAQNNFRRNGIASYTIFAEKWNWLSEGKAYLGVYAFFDLARVLVPPQSLRNAANLAVKTTAPKGTRRLFSFAKYVILKLVNLTPIEKERL